MGLCGEICGHCGEAIFGFRGQDSQEKSRRSVYYRHKGKILSLPPALLQAALSYLILMLREQGIAPGNLLETEEPGPDAYFTFMNPFGAQVFMIVLGYLLVTRLSLIISRWDSGCQGMTVMISKWADAHATLSAFIETEYKKKDTTAEHRERLNVAHQAVTHYFSLLHAIALINLRECVGEAYGGLSQKGVDDVLNLKSFPISRVLEVHGPEVKLGNYEDHGVGHHETWTRKLSILGELTEEEKMCLQSTSSMVDAVNIWILGLFTSALNTVMSVPPPVYTRVYQEVSNGMQGFQDALRVSQIPLPPVVTHLSNGLLICSFVLMPFIVEQTVKSRVLTPLITFVAAYCYLLIHCIANLLERPYGDDFIDLPMHEMQTCFNRKLEAAVPLDLNDFKPKKKPLKNGDIHQRPEDVSTARNGSPEPDL